VLENHGKRSCQAQKTSKLKLVESGEQVDPEKELVSKLSTLFQDPEIPIAQWKREFPGGYLNHRKKFRSETSDNMDR